MNNAQNHKGKENREMVGMSAYASEIKSWVSKTRAQYADRIPEGFPLDFANYNLPDETLHQYAMGLYNAIAAGKKTSYSAPAAQEAAPASKLMYVVPVESSDGSVTFLDRYSGKVIAGSYNMGNGLFSYYGTKDVLEVLFGRGGLDRMWSRTEDHSFFHDQAKK
jgi:hypothetical protein